MLLEIYLLLGVVSFVFMIVGFFRESLPIFSFDSGLIFAVLSVSSGNIEFENCSLSGGAWTCASTYGSAPLVALMGGLSLLMFTYAFLSFFVWSKERIEEAVNKGAKL